jgi:putative FmdB family regulatory protein
MPTYVYECSKCGDELEVWQSFSDDALKKHAGCGGKLTKVLQPVGIVLKGPGFYKTDSRNGKKSSTTSDSSSETNSSSTKSETSSAGDAKTAKKTEKPSSTTANSTS